MAADLGLRRRWDRQGLLIAVPCTPSTLWSLTIAELRLCAGDTGRSNLLSVSTADARGRIKDEEGGMRQKASIYLMARRSALFAVGCGDDDNEPTAVPTENFTASLNGANE